MKPRLVLFIVATLLFMAAPLLFAGLLLWSDLPAESRVVLEEMLAPRAALVVFVLMIAGVLGAALARQLWRMYPGEALRLVESVKVLTGPNPAYRPSVDGMAELQALAEAIGTLADQRDAARRDVETQIRESRASLEAERNRLAALVADLPLPVIVCNLDGRILLYNNRARLQARALVPDTHGAGAAIGLGRSIHGVFDRSLISHSLDTLQHRLEREGSQPLAHFVTTTRAGQLIRVQMAPVTGGEGEEGGRRIGGYVLVLENLTKTAEGGAPAGGWPLEEMLGADLLTAAGRRIENRAGLAVKVDAVAPDLWVKVDSYALVQAFCFLAAKLREDFGVRLVRLSLARAQRMAHFDLRWSGMAVSTELLLGWQLDPLTVGGEASPLALRDVTDRHGGQLSCGRESATQQSFFRIELPVAAAQDAAEGTPLVRVESRPEFYDFDLFNRVGEDHARDETPLADLIYTAFDTETTGLEPSAGDEIIQIGAVRIVNGRLLRHENMDQIIDPRRPLRPEGIPIHGITEEMVCGQPTISTVLPQFHAFCDGTVLVAHNAAFDMRFFQLKEETLGIRFTHPVLDTLLLSAVIHPNQESHKLEAIAERLGITIIGRHTALGDAIVTAEVFLRMLPLLADMGIHTLGEALAAAEKTYYARIKY